MFCSFIIDTDFTKHLELNLASPVECTQEPLVGTKHNQSPRRRHVPQGGHHTSAQLQKTNPGRCRQVTHRAGSRCLSLSLFNSDEVSKGTTLRAKTDELLERAKYSWHLTQRQWLHPWAGEKKPLTTCPSSSRHTAVALFEGMFRLNANSHSKRMG